MIGGCCGKAERKAASRSRALRACDRARPGDTHNDLCPPRLPAAAPLSDLSWWFFLYRLPIAGTAGGPQVRRFLEFSQY